MNYITMTAKNNTEILSSYNNLSAADKCIAYQIFVTECDSNESWLSWYCGDILTAYHKFGLFSDIVVNIIHKLHKADLTSLLETISQPELPSIVDPFQQFTYDHFITMK